jgi:hypothetical protein
MSAHQESSPASRGSLPTPPTTLPCPGLDASAGASARSWGLGPGASGAQLARFEAALAPLAGALERGGGPFLCGPRLSAADCVVFPFVERFELALRIFSGYDLGGASAAGADVAGWLVRLCVCCVCVRGGGGGGSAWALL